MKRIVFALVGIFCLTLFGKITLERMFSAGIPEDEARLTVATQKLEKAKSLLSKVGEETKEKIFGEVDSLSMEVALLNYNLAASRFYAEIGVFTLAYTAVKNKFEKGYFKNKYYSYIYEKVKDVSLEDCNEDFQKAFRGLLEGLNSPKKGDLSKFEQSLYKIYQDHSKKSFY